MTISFQLTELTKLGFISPTDGGEYHLTDLGKAAFRFFQRLESAKRSGQPLSEKEISDLLNEECQEELKKWGRRFLRSLKDSYNL